MTDLVDNGLQGVQYWICQWIQGQNKHGKPAETQEFSYYLHIEVNILVKLKPLQKWKKLSTP